MPFTVSSIVLTIFFREMVGVAHSIVDLLHINLNLKLQHNNQSDL